MAATASIIIEVNDAGATQAFQRINAEGAALGNNLKKAGSTGNIVFTDMASQQEKVRQGMQLLGNTLGVHIPRALETIISKTPALADALGAAFQAGVVVSFAKVVVDAVDQLIGYSAALAVIIKQSQDLMQTAEQANKITRGPQTYAQLRDQVLKATQSVEDLNRKLGLTGNFNLDGLARGMARFSEQGRYALDQLDHQKKLLNDLTLEEARLGDQETRTEPIEILKLENQARLAGLQGIAQINEAERGQTQVFRAEVAARIVHVRVGQAQILEIHAQSAAKRKEYERSVTETIIGLQKQVELSGKSEVTKLTIETAAEIDKVDRLYKQGKLSFTEAEQEKTALADAANKKRAEMEHNVVLAGEEAILQATASGTKGRVQIEQEYAAKIKQIEDQEVKSGINMQRQKDAAQTEENNKLLNLAREQAKKLREINSQTELQERNAAIEMAPPWERANARIVEDYRQRMEKVNEMLADGEITSDQAARRMAAAWQVEFAQKRDEIASQMETLFDDITSGNIGKAFLTRFKHMVFEMLATWITGMRGMQTASQQAMSTGGGGVLGAIFGALGLGGIGGGGGGGQGNISNLPGVITNLGELPLDNSPGVISNLAGLGLSAGGGVTGIGATLPAGASTGSAAAGGGIMGLLKGGMLNQLLVMGGAGLLINGAGRGGILGVLESAAGGAMSGFGIGAMIGAGLGPIGMGIGALIGGLVGLFSGLFGQHTGDKARINVMEPLNAQIKVIQDSYDVFATDFNTGVSELEALRATSIAALQKIGGKQVSGNSKWVNVDIDAAELHLKTTEAERNRRAQIDFGPPQFLTGGFVGSDLCGTVPSWFAASALHFSSGGGVPAILHPNEFVLRESAVQRVGRSNLERMNAGGSAGGDTHNHFTINAIDAKSFEGFLDGGGGRKIVRYLVRGNSEGGF